LFRVTLELPVDNVTDVWWEGEPHAKDGHGHIAMGVLLIVSVGERYAELTFYASGGAASTVLFESPSAHERLLWVLRKADGLAGAIVTDTVVEVRDLAPPNRLLAIDWDWLRADDERHFLDRMAEQVIHQTERPSRG
jgi:hypothetical protein